MMTIEQRLVHDAFPLVRAEYLEMPGLILTKPQIQRLCQLDPAVCDAVLDELVAADFLEKTSADAYGLAATVNR